LAGTFGWQLITSLASGRIDWSHQDPEPGPEQDAGARAGQAAGSGAADGTEIGPKDDNGNDNFERLCISMIIDSRCLGEGKRLKL